MSLRDRAHERASAIFLLVLLLAGAGVWAARKLPSSIFPTVTFPRVKMIADAGEVPAAQMIPAVTRPLEEALLRVPGIERVISTTTRGSVEIGAEFVWGTDMQAALQRVQAQAERIRPDLPAGTRVEAQWMNTAIFPILGYALTSETKSPSELWEYAEFTLKPELIRISGVSEVQVQGGRRREFQVRLDSGQLAGRKLAVSDVIETIRKNNLVESAGLVESNHELYLTLVSGRAEGIDALSRISVPVPGGGRPASLREIASIGTADAVSYIRTAAGGRPAVLVNIIRQPSANTVAIARGVDELFHRMPELLPRDIQWTTTYDQAEFVRDSVNGVRDAILIGIGLAAAILLLYLRSARVTLIAVATIPLTVALVLLGLSVAGQTINLMTLGGIAAAIGLVADDAIVVVENIMRHVEEGVSNEPARTGLSEIFPALLGSSLSTIVIFFPFALLSGVAGAFFRPLALTMGLALAFSFLLAGFVVPAAVGWFRVEGARKARHRREPKIARYFIARPLLALLLTVLLFSGGWMLYRALGSDFLPEMDEGSIILDYRTPPGTSLTDTDRMLREVEKIVLSISDVAAYSRRTGTELGFFVTEPNRGDYVIRLKPRAQRRNVDDVIEELRSRIAATEPAVRTDFGQLLEDNIGDLAGGTSQPIDVKIFGEDQALLQEKARSAAAILRHIAGLEDVFDGITIAGPELTIQGKPDALTRYGLTTESLHSEIEPALTGTVAGNLRFGERLYDIRVFNAGSNVADLPSLPIRAGGTLVPLATVAAISAGAPEAEVNRENLKSYLGVTARLSGRSLGDAVSEIRRQFASKLPLPPGMSIRFGGLYEQQQASFKGLLNVLLGGLLLVAVVILFEFGDWRAALLTVLMALAVLASVFGSLLATGMTFNISSFVGAIMMVGIVGEKTIFLIHDAREALRRGVPVHEAWEIASQKRVRAVMMTIFATAFALAPLALAMGQGSQLQQPLAIAVIGGFILSSPLVLVVLPSLYAWMDPNGRLGGRMRAER